MECKDNSEDTVVGMKTTVFYHSTMECKDNSGDTVVEMKTTVFYHNTSTQRWSVKITVETQWLDEDNSVLPQHLHSTMECKDNSGDTVVG